LPRIIHISHRHGHFNNLSKLDLVDGFHQMPLKRTQAFHVHTQT